MNRAVLHGADDRSVAWTSHCHVTANLDGRDLQTDSDSIRRPILPIWSCTNPTAFLPRPTHAEWKALYRAAILETNKSIIPEKVFEAESAVLARGRGLFYAQGTSEEKQELEDALYALRAFRCSLQHAEAA